MNGDRFVPALLEKTSEPLPLDEDASTSFDNTSRLWIGNMDNCLTEFSMLQILKKYGKIKQFDFLVHKAGALAGQSRGFCFVSFEKREDAENVITKLNNKFYGKKSLQIRWAHENNRDLNSKDVLKLPSDILNDKNTAKSTNTATLNKKTSNPESMIRAIEQKLTEMQKSGDSKPNPKLHPLLVQSKQKALEIQKQQSQPYYKRKRHKK